MSPHNIHTQYVYFKVHVLSMYIDILEVDRTHVCMCSIRSRYE
uniref:Uncharacterized protein n=1 Tax=viral metagenome TaxID=1070528 RepID=A0A6C0LXG3_9ZZZZ